MNATIIIILARSILKGLSCWISLLLDTVHMLRYLLVLDNNFGGIFNKILMFHSCNSKTLLIRYKMKFSIHETTFIWWKYFCHCTHSLFVYCSRAYISGPNTGYIWFRHSFQVKKIWLKEVVINIAVGLNKSPGTTTTTLLFLWKLPMNHNDKTVACVRVK